MKVNREKIYGVIHYSFYYVYLYFIIKIYFTDFIFMKI